MLAFIWAAVVIGAHVYYSIKLVPYGPQSFFRQLPLELVLGPNLGTFWPTYLFHLASGSLFFAGAFLIGELIFSALLPETKHPMRSSFAIGLGLAAVGNFALVLGFAGQFRAPVMDAFFICICVAGVWRIIKQFRVPAGTATTAPTSIEKLFVAIMLLAICLAFLGTTVPENSYDALTYHLAVPQQYLFAGRVIDLPHNRFSYLPLLASMTFSWGLAAGGAPLAKIFNFFIGLALLNGIKNWGKALLSREAGIMAATVFAACPLTIYLLWVCNSDLLTALFLLLALASLWTWQSDSENGNRLLYLGGLFCGLALATKYTAAFGVFAGGVIVTIRLIRNGKAVNPKAIVLAGLLVLLPLAPWWMRNFQYTGNPFFPVFATELGPKTTDLSLLKDWYADSKGGTPGIAPIHHAGKLWDDATKGFVDFAEHNTGPAFLAFLLFAAFCSSSVEAGWLVAFSGVAIACGLSNTYITRYLLLYFVPLALALSLGVVTISEQSPLKRLAVALLGASLFFSVYRMSEILLMTSMKGLGFVTGQLSTDDYLGRPRNYYPNPPYPAFKFLSTLGLSPQDHVLLEGEARSFYSPMPVISNTIHDIPIVYDWANHSANPDELFAKFKSEGITVFLVNRPEGAKNDAKSYVNPRAVAMISYMLEHHFEKVYEDPAMIAFRQKG